MAEAALRAELEAAKAELETFKAQQSAATVNSEQAFHRLEQDHIQLKQRHEKTREELRTLRHEAGNAEKQRAVADASAANLRTTLATKEAEAERLGREGRELKEERDGLLSRVTRLLEESKERNAEMQSYATRLEESYKLRHELQDKVDELQKASRTAQFELHRANEAKELGEKHTAWLTDELDIKQKELSQLRTERADSTRDLQQKADDSAEEAAKLAGQIGVLRASAEAAEKKTQQLELELQGKLTALQEQEDCFKSDLGAREQLEKVLKEGLKDAESKVKEVTEVLKKQQEQMVGKERLHAEAQEKAGRANAELQQQLEAAKAQVVEAAKAAKAAPAAAAAAAAPVPAAAAAAALSDASNTVVGGADVRMSEVMAAKIGVENELREVKLENKRLNNYLNSILVELEQKAPLINEQREAYEKAIRAHGRITTSLDETKQELRTPRQHHLTVRLSRHCHLTRSSTRSSLLLISSN